MLFDWYNLFSLTEFLAEGLVSRTLHVNLEGVGQRDILVTKGNQVSLIYEDVILPINFQNQNPYSRAGEKSTYAVYQDSNNDIWLGIATS
jgi:hypothetical protein